MNQRSVCCTASAARLSSLLCIAALSCGEPSGLGERPVSEPDAIHPIGGGQSGGEGSIACVFEPKHIATTTSNGIPLTEWLTPFRAAFERPTHAQWWPIVREPTPIPPTQVELLDLQIDSAIQEGCSSFQISVVFRARSADGQLDGHFEGHLTGYTFGERNLELAAAMVGGEFRDGPVRAGLDPDATLSFLLYLEALDPDNLSGTLQTTSDGNPIAWIGKGAQTWSATEPQPKERRQIAISRLQSSICRNPAPTARATFASEAVLRESLAHTWVACSGAGRVDPDFAGLSIDANGHWHELRTEGDALIAVQGFGREGQVTRNFFTTDFNLAILDWLPQRYEFANAELSADGNTLRLTTQGLDNTLEATFQASDVPVQYLPPRHPKGTRAGLAACDDDDEVDITSRPTSESELRGLLIGRWMFCTGDLGTSKAGVVFGADDSFRFLEADGGEAPEPAGRFVIVDSSSMNGAGAYQVNLYSATTAVGALAMPIFSNAPLKLMANDEYRSVLSAF